MIKFYLHVIGLFVFLMAAPVLADTKPMNAASGDLILGPGIEDGENFYKNGIYRLGDKSIYIQEGVLSGDKPVQYNPDKATITVNTNPTITDAEKGAALFGMLEAISLQGIAPAAGSQNDGLPSLVDEKNSAQ